MGSTHRLLAVFMAGLLVLMTTLEVRADGNPQSAPHWTDAELPTEEQLRDPQSPLVYQPEEPPSISPDPSGVVPDGPVYEFQRPGVPHAIVVLSWNLKTLNKKESPESIQIMANVLQFADVAVIQEVKSHEASMKIFKQISMVSSIPYGFIMTPFTGDPDNQEREAYFFLWRRDRIVLTDPGTFSTQGTMVRQPYYAAFRCLEDVQQCTGGNQGSDKKAFDFILQVLHTKPADGVVQAEMQGALINYNQLVNRFGHSEPDIILAGDFNGAPPNSLKARPGDSAFRKEFKHHRYALQGSAFRSMVELLVEQGKRARLNDNLIWREPTDEDYVNVKGLIAFEDHPFFNTTANRKAAVRAVSDHRAAWALFWAHCDSR